MALSLKAGAAPAVETQETKSCGVIETEIIRLGGNPNSWRVDVHTNTYRAELSVGQPSFAQVLITPSTVVLSGTMDAQISGL